MNIKHKIEKHWETRTQLDRWWHFIVMLGFMGTFIGFIAGEISVKGLIYSPVTFINDIFLMTFNRITPTYSSLIEFYLMLCMVVSIMILGCKQLFGKFKPEDKLYYSYFYYYFDKFMLWLPVFYLLDMNGELLSRHYDTYDINISEHNLYWYGKYYVDRSFDFTVTSIAFMTSLIYISHKYFKPQDNIGKYWESTLLLPLVLLGLCGLVYIGAIRNESVKFMEYMNHITFFLDRVTGLYTENVYYNLSFTIHSCMTIGNYLIIFFIIKYTRQASSNIRKLLKGQPTDIIKNKKIMFKYLDNLKYTLDDDIKIIDKKDK